MSAKVFHSQNHKYSSISEESRGGFFFFYVYIFFFWTCDKIVVNFHLKRSSSCVVGQIVSPGRKKVLTNYWFTNELHICKSRIDESLYSAWINDAVAIANMP